MSVLPYLATSLNRRDEVPNQELGRKIAASNDTAAIEELVANLKHKDKGIQGDCIKALYEAGTIKPVLIAGYMKHFIALLDSKNNRLQWGAMHALYTMTDEDSKAVYKALPQLAAAADRGSVITRDNYVAILVKLGRIKQYHEEVFALLNEQLMSCPVNQLPMYAENALPIINHKNREIFINTLHSRLDDFEIETKRKRVEKVLKKLAK